jgi:hypothetical protein
MSRRNGAIAHLVLEIEHNESNGPESGEGDRQYVIGDDEKHAPTLPLSTQLRHTSL